MTRTGTPKYLTRAVGATLTALLIAGGATACASGTKVSVGAPGGGGSSSASPSPSGGSVMQPGGPPQGASSSAGAVGHAMKASSYRADSSKLTVFFIGGVCAQYGLSADESTPGKVLVHVTVTKAPAKGQMCPSLAKLQSLTTTLHAPLDNRPVIDASDNQHLAVHPGLTGGPGSQVTHGPVTQ